MAVSRLTRIDQQVYCERLKTFPDPGEGSEPNKELA